LKSVPKLRELAFSPDSLRLVRRSDENDEILTPPDGNMDPYVESSTEFVQALGETLPRLEYLDLRTRWFGYGIYYCSSSEPILAQVSIRYVPELRNVKLERCAQDLVTALARIPNLKQLFLPSSVMTNTQFDMLRTPIPISAPETARENLPALKAIIDSRHRVLEDVTVAEWDVVEQISAQGVGLEYVSFVRNYFPDDPVEYEVRYGTSRNHMGSRLSTPRMSTIVSVKLIEARDGQESPWPFAPSLSLSHTLRRLWSSSPHLSRRQSKHARSIEDSNADGTSRSMLRSEGSLVTSLFVGSALFAYSTLVGQS